MRLGRAEKAGSGVDKILNGWNLLGWAAPFVEEEVRPDYVVLTMPIGEPIKKTHQESSGKVEKRMRQIVDFCEDARTFQEIMEFIGLKDRVNFKKTYVDPLIATGKLCMTEQENPTSRNQHYVTTKKKK